MTDLARALDQLRGSRSQASLTKRAADGGISALPKSTVSDLLSGRSVPSRQTLVAFLTACGLVTRADHAPWLAAWERVANAHFPRPPGAVRVREARPRLLGVHAAIQLDAVYLEQRTEGEADDGLPQYVPRDLDGDLHAKLVAARERGGFVLLKGDSSVGKTRALFQGLRVVAPEWWLLRAADPVTVTEFAAAPAKRTIVWLDELQIFLDHPAGLSAATIHSLITAGTMVVATLWPDEYDIRTAARIPGQPDPHANDRQLLGFAEIVSVPGEFSSCERQRAEDIADTDRRIRIALDTPDAGFTQVMAAGPRLIDHWENAPAAQCYGQAVITAALDARRVGARAPVSRSYLRDAARGYLTARQRAEAPGGWLEQALGYATRPLHGAAATLTPISAAMGETSGYQTADYLHQHALKVRRTKPLPDSAWQALVDHHHPDDLLSLAGNAQSRGRNAEAETLYRQAAGAVPEAATRLSYLVVDPDQVDQDQVDEVIILLRPHADANELGSAMRLVDLLVRNGRTNELAERAEFDRHAAIRLSDQLVTEDRIDDAISLLRRLYLRDPDSAVVRLTRLLSKRGQIDEAIDIVRNHATDHDYGFALAAAAEHLADLLYEEGKVEEAFVLLRLHADKPGPAMRLADLLATEGRTDELSQRADTDDWAAVRFAYLLVEQDRFEEAVQLLGRHADMDSTHAASSLAQLLISRGRLDEAVELQTRQYAGTTFALGSLSDALADHGLIAALMRCAEAGDTFAARKLAELGYVDDAIRLLRHLDDTGHLGAGGTLSELLVEHGRIDQLTGEAAAGTSGAVAALRDVHSRPTAEPL